MNQKISPTEIRKILLCLFELKLSIRQTALRLNISRDSVIKYKKLFQISELNWPLSETITDKILLTTLSPKSPLPTKAILIDFNVIHEELKRHKGATIYCLYREWLSQLTNEQQAIGYKQFCKRYRKYKDTLRISLRHVHHPAEAAFVDYSGVTVPITNQKTGEVIKAQIFVGVLGYSNFTFCEATASQKIEDWVMSHVRMFEYFNGVPTLIVHDNLKSAVIKADKNFPEINQTYEQMCQFYHTHPFAARAYHPKDKAKAEATVQLVQRWILFRLRNRLFFSLTEVNQAIAPLLAQLNHKNFQKIEGSRYSKWRDVEQKALLPLPVQKYEYGYWGTVYAGLDYHVVIDKHAYSIPHALRSQPFVYCKEQSVIKLYHNHNQVTTHIRSRDNEGKTTLTEHMPVSHREASMVSVEAILEWALKTVGENGRLFLETVINKHTYHYQNYRLFTGMKNLCHRFAPEIVELACQDVLTHNKPDISLLRYILKHRLPVLAQQNRETNKKMLKVFVVHKNIRGKDYYQHKDQVNKGMKK